MKTLSKSQSRRAFLKGVAINGAALSTIPLGVLGDNYTTADPVKMETDPRLPLRIMMMAELSDPFREKLTKISPRIHLEESDQAIGDVNAWFGSINQDQFKKASNLKWVHSTSAGVEHYLFPEMVQSDVILTNAKGCYGPAIAEHTFGLLFALSRNIGSQTRNMSEGKWQPVDMDNMFEMKGKTKFLDAVFFLDFFISQRIDEIHKGRNEGKHKHYWESEFGCDKSTCRRCHGFPQSGPKFILTEDFTGSYFCWILF